MKLIFTLLLVVLARSALGQHTVTGADMTGSGYILNLYLSGAGTNGTYNLGWATNRPIDGSQKMRLYVNSPGYNDDGSTNVTQRVLFGLGPVRFKFPDEAFKDELLVTGGVRLRFFTSERVNSADVITKLEVDAGVYTQGGTSNSAATLTTVTNSSAESYAGQKTIAKWAWPGFQNVRTATWTNEVKAYNWSARNGRPVRAVKFWVTDRAGTTVTQWVTTPKVDFSAGDAVPVATYQATFSTNSFTNSTLLTMNFAAFPWIGDTNSVYDTSKSPFSQPSPKATQITNAIYEPVYAIVDSVNGNDSTGVASPRSSYQSSTNLARFLTIAGALTAIQATNGILFTRTNVDAGIVMLSDTGTHTNLGATVTLTGLQAVGYEVMPYPGTDPYSSRIVKLNDPRLKDDSDMRIDRGTYWDTSDATLISRHRHWWLDGGVILNATGAALWQNATVPMAVYFTRVTVSNLTQGLRPVSTQNAQLSLTRGCRIVGNLNNTQIDARCFIGNLNFGSYSNYTVSDQITGTGGDYDEAIIADNRLYNMRKLASIVSIGNDFSISNGVAVVNNLFETATNDSATISFQFGTVPTLNYTNVMIWDNALLGCKTFIAYADQGTNTLIRYGWSRYNNIFDDGNIKTDIFTGSGGGSAARFGNWSMVNGVGCFNEAWLETAGIGAPGSFTMETLPPFTWDTTTGSTSSTNYPKFFNRQANDGNSPFMAGFGDYRLHSSSPLFTRNRRSKWVTSHDVFGYARSVVDPPGPHAGSARKGIFF